MCMWTIAVPISTGGQNHMYRYRWLQITTLTVELLLQLVNAVNTMQHLSKWKTHSHETYMYNVNISTAVHTYIVHVSQKGDSPLYIGIVRVWPASYLENLRFHGNMQPIQNPSLRKGTYGQNMGVLKNDKCKTINSLRQYTCTCTCMYYFRNWKV